MSVRVKICGLTRDEDVAVAVECGASLLGFIAVPSSPRALPIERIAELTSAVPSGIACVLVVRDEHADTLQQWCERAPHITHLQLHGDEAPELVAAVRAATNRTIIKAVPVDPDGSMMLLDTGADFDLLDTKAGTLGGSGRAFDWSVLEVIDAPTRSSRILLAGGITPDNVAEAARTGVFALDLASGVEIPDQPGIKDHARMRALFAALPTTAA